MYKLRFPPAVLVATLSLQGIFLGGCGSKTAPPAANAPAATTPAPASNTAPEATQAAPPTAHSAPTVTNTAANTGSNTGGKRRSGLERSLTTFSMISRSKSQPTRPR